MKSHPLRTQASSGTSPHVSFTKSQMDHFPNFIYQGSIENPRNAQSQTSCHRRQDQLQIGCHGRRLQIHFSWPASSHWVPLKAQSDASWDFFETPHDPLRYRKARPWYLLLGRSNCVPLVPLNHWSRLWEPQTIEATSGVNFVVIFVSFLFLVKLKALKVCTAFQEVSHVGTGQNLNCLSSVRLLLSCVWLDHTLLDVLRFPHS